MKLLKRTDVLVILILLAVGLAGLLIYRSMAAGKPAEAQIYYGSELKLTLPLKQGGEKTFSLPEKPGVVFELLEDGSIRFQSSDCPDKVCVRSGKLRLPGESAACLPNQLILKIVAQDGAAQGSPDLVAG